MELVKIGDTVVNLAMMTHAQMLEGGTLILCFCERNCAYFMGQEAAQLWNHLQRRAGRPMVAEPAPKGDE